MICRRRPGWQHVDLPAGLPHVLRAAPPACHQRRPGAGPLAQPHGTPVGPRSCPAPQGRQGSRQALCEPVTRGRLCSRVAHPTAPHRAALRRCEWHGRVALAHAASPSAPHAPKAPFINYLVCLAVTRGVRSALQASRGARDCRPGSTQLHDPRPLGLRSPATTSTSPQQPHTRTHAAHKVPCRAAPCRAEPCCAEPCCAAPPGTWGAQAASLPALDVRIKWPNDVYAAGVKIGGALIHTTWSAGRCEAGGAPLRLPTALHCGCWREVEAVYWVADAAGLGAGRAVRGGCLCPASQPFVSRGEEEPVARRQPAASLRAALGAQARRVSPRAHSFNVVTGIGLNVNNRSPTTCLDALIEQAAAVSWPRTRCREQPSQPLLGGTAT
jgi:hypothetical protein